MKIRQRFLLLFATAALVPVLVSGGVAYVLIRRSTIELASGSLDALAAIQESRVDDIVSQNGERLSSITNRTELRRLLAEYGAGTGDREDLRSQMTELVNDALRAGESFWRVSVTDPQGTVVASTRETDVGASLALEPYFQEGHSRNVVTYIHREDEGGPVLFRLVGPIFNGGKRVGSAVIEADATNLFSLARDYRGLGRTGETIIIRPADDGGGEVIAPMRSDPDAALRRRISPTDDMPPSLMALRRREQVLRDVKDIRGVQVYAATRYVDAAGFGIVVKMDTEEVLSPLRPLRTLLLEAVLAAAAAAFVLGVYASRRMSLPIIRLTQIARRIAESGDAARVDTEGDDEAANLAESFNIMVDKLLAERRRLEISVKSIPVGVLIAGADGAIILRNDRLGAILGLHGRNYSLRDVAAALPSSAGLEERISECEQRGRVVELREVQLGGRTVRILLSPIAARSDARAAGFILLAEDVSEAKRLEQAKNEFVSVASHQLRTPLTAIKGGTSMLLDRDLGPLTEKQDEFLKDIKRSNDRMIALVNSLLNVSRIDLGVFAVDPEPTDLRELAESVVKELQVTIDEKHLTFDAEYDPALGKMNADPRLLRMVFQNLLSNAVKYTPNGGTVTLDVRRDASKIVITVTDTGYGIPAAQQEKIFSKMFRADNARQHDPDGSGLGLYIVKAIVESAGGLIGFTSVEDKGTVFRVSLPATGMRAKAGEKRLQ